MIDANGAFRAGQNEGRFVVEATAGGLNARAMVLISKDDAPASPPLPKPKPEARTMEWTGSVPPQKWMNFYTKVLAKFATNSDLKLTVKFKVTPEGGLSPHQIEETKATLRELGLDDDVTSDS